MKVVKYPQFQNYEELSARARDFTMARGPGVEDELWLAEHQPIFTIGRDGVESDILNNTRGVRVIRSDRGGKATYMGPGILGVYTLVDMRTKSYTVREFSSRLELGVIDTLAKYNIVAVGDPDRHGVYIGDRSGAKIASLGLAYRNHCIYQGIVIYFRRDREIFDQFILCGEPLLRVTDVVSLAGSVPQEEFEDSLLANLQQRVL